MGFVDDNDWTSNLLGHPVFSRPNTSSFAKASTSSGLELSTSTLSMFASLGLEDDKLQDKTSSGRKQIMLLKDSELILAMGREIRMAAVGESKVGIRAAKSAGESRTYKTLCTPAITFDIHQMCLNPTNRVLAVAGSYQVAIVVLPRPGYSKLVSQTVDCKAISVGRYYHGSKSSAPIAKIAWHPWGEAGSTLLVMTVDGKMREYDISMDTEEPQQVLSFVPEKKKSSFVAEDNAEHEVASFTLGQGKANWGPLTMYAVMRSGDIYAMCPYMPKNASIPSSYIHSLECLISAKQEFLASNNSSETRKLSVYYDYQRKYVSALVKQLPPGTTYPAVSRSVLIHPPTTIKSKPLRQGPFLLQPSPRSLEGSEGGDATDIMYLAFGSENEGTEGETELLGLVLVSYQDGRIDVCLDVENVEARWEKKYSQEAEAELPMLAVYETIDLGLIELLSLCQPPLLDLIQGNHIVLFADPIHEDTVYVYHAFGVHVIQLRRLVQHLAASLRVGDDDETGSIRAYLEKDTSTTVTPILTTFSVERRCSNPVIAVAIPTDVFLTYSILILTSSMRITCFPLNVSSDSPSTELKSLPSPSKSTSQKTLENGKAPIGPQYFSLLEAAPFTPPAAFSRTHGLPANPRLSLGGGAVDTQSKEFMLTPETLRYLATTVERLTSQIHDIQLAFRDTVARSSLQAAEGQRQKDKLLELSQRIKRLNEGKRAETGTRIERLKDGQASLLGKTDRVLRRLMEEASPGLSEHEKNWFEELKRMKAAIEGEGRFDEESLVARTASLEKEYARLLPKLTDLRAKEADHRRQSGGIDSLPSIGASQVTEINKRSSTEGKKIESLEKKLLEMASTLGVSLAKPS